MGSEENFTNIYINNLDNSVNEASLRQICEQICGIGTVKTLVIFKARNDHSMGYGFCNFINHQCALRAIKYMNSMIIGSKKISAARATPKNDRDQYKRSLSQLSQAPELNANVYIKNFDSFVNEELLRNAFSRFGTIINVRIMRNLSGFSKGFGFVSFSRHEDAVRAIKEMNGTNLAGRIISVDFYTPKNSRRSPENDNRLSQNSSVSSSSASNSTSTSASFSASSEEEEEEEEEKEGQEESSPELFIPLQQPENDFSEYDIQGNNYIDYDVSDDVNQCFLSEESNDDDDDEGADDNDGYINNNGGNGYYDVIDDVTAELLGTHVSEEEEGCGYDSNAKPFVPFVPMNNTCLSHKMNDSGNFKSEPRSYKIVVHNLRYVFDEKEVRKIFYDFKDFKVKQLLNSRKLPTGDWKVTFRSEKDMERALSICNSLIVRGQRIFANEYRKIPSFNKRRRPSLTKVTFSDLKGSTYLNEACESPLKTSFSSPSTPQFKPRLTPLPAATFPKFGEYDTPLSFDPNNNNNDNKKEEETCKKRSMSLTSRVPPSFVGSGAGGVSRSPTVGGGQATQGCKSVSEQIADAGIYDGPLAELDAGYNYNYNYNYGYGFNDMVLFGSLDNTINTPFSAVNNHNFGF